MSWWVDECGWLDGWLMSGWMDRWWIGEWMGGGWVDG